MTPEPTVGLSVITVHLNDFSALEATRESLLPLLVNDGIEWVVQDGGSTPETEADQAILERVKDTTPLYLSEPDLGIYDAMNRATARSEGRYLLYLNAGDQRHPGLELTELLRHITGDAGMVWFGCEDRDRAGRVYARSARSAKALWLGMPVSHQAILFHRKVMPSPPYADEFRFAGDYHLVCRLLQKPVRVESVDAPLVIFDLVGRSSGNKTAALAEEKSVRREVLGTPGPVNALIFVAKWLAWHAGSAVPSLRAFWRQRF